MKSHAPPLPLEDLATLLSAEVPAGLAGTVITGINTLGEAGETEASFLARPKLRPQVPGSRARVILAPERLQLRDPRTIHVPDVWVAVVAVLGHFFPAPAQVTEIHPSAVVAADAVIGANVRIGPNAVVGEGVTIGDNVTIGPLCCVGRDVTIGEGCILYDRITLAAGTILGRRVMIHSGAVIGADGFKYEVGAKGLLKIPQVGHVVVEDDVEIGANATIDRASFSVTRIGARTKLDNMVHIAHNCDVGSDCLIAAQTGIAGSTRVGRGVLMGGQVGIADNASVGDGCKIAAKAGIRGDIPAGAELSGAPAIDAKRFNRVWAISTRLPEIYMKVRPLLKGLDGDEFAEL